MALHTHGFTVAASDLRPVEELEDRWVDILSKNSGLKS